MSLWLTSKEATKKKEDVVLKVSAFENRTLITNESLRSIFIVIAIGRGFAKTTICTCGQVKKHTARCGWIQVRD